ncbi:MAG TPA: hypothetical protein PLG31_13640 [Spirochaetota bacterium]|nr:hypothetical protein [Spirochaetota bacterium]
MNKLVSSTVVVLGLLLAVVLVSGISPMGIAAPKAGGSCTGIGPMDGRVACDGKKVIACSSYTKYKYIVTQTCSATQKCVAAADGKSASCK